MVIQIEFLEDLEYWIKEDTRIARRPAALMKAILRDPFDGIGKPEPLKYFPGGAWSRRLTEEHRVVYRIEDDQIDFLQARYHY